MDVMEAQAPRTMEQLIKDGCFRECQARAVVAYYMRMNQNIDLVTGHFEDEGVPRRRILDIIGKFKKNGMKDFKFEKRGRKSTVTSDENVSRVRQLFEADPEMSVRKASQELKLNTKAILRILDQKLKYKCVTQGKTHTWMATSKTKKKKSPVTVPARAKVADEEVQLTELASSSNQQNDPPRISSIQAPTMSGQFHFTHDDQQTIVFF